MIPESLMAELTEHLDSWAREMCAKMIKELESVYRPKNNVAFITIDDWPTPEDTQAKQ